MHLHMISGSAGDDQAEPTRRNGPVWSGSILKASGATYEAHRVGPTAAPDCPFASGSSSAAP